MAASIIIAIDGPSASGKSSTSKVVAERLGYLYADTGSMYRTVAWWVLKNNVDPVRTEDVVRLIRSMQYECDFIDTTQGYQALRNRVEGEDPGKAIREPEVESAASMVATLPEVRSLLVEKQRSLALQGNLVIEGRDMGTVVFPETPYKFFLEADPAVRARRRTRDQKDLGLSSEEKDVEKAIHERDRRDSSRREAPMKVAADAIRIDTSPYSVEETADIILKHIRSRHLAGS